jgi:hypothetical protein
MSMQKRFALDAKLRRVALRKGFDSIVLFTPRAYQAFLRSGTIPRSIELNVLDLARLAKRDGDPSPKRRPR